MRIKMFDAPGRYGQFLDLYAAMYPSRRPVVKAATPQPPAQKPVEKPDPRDQWNNLVALLQKEGRSRMDAIATAAKEFPELHREYLVAHNKAVNPLWKRFQNQQIRIENLNKGKGVKK